ncbi:replication initiation factor domain-containing protein [Candidatus Izemoplasma sp. B36]|uniref:replication initiation factor domain-containing protein n=1 Tax=Candidatus Izemoplasma sp. B36 TaxID=3242468 RepID=UPI0035581A05
MVKCLTDGGCNNIPPTGQPNELNETVDVLDSLVSEIELDKRILFDWISYTFDDLHEFDISNGETKLDEHSSLVLKELLRLLGSETLDWRQAYVEDKTFNGYKFSLIIGESIIINCCGPRSARNRRTTQLLMRGEGCREFIEHQKGNWYDLFQFLLGTTRGHFKRIDLAIDDFQGKELNIYDLEDLSRKKMWTGIFRSFKCIHNFDISGEDLISKGYSLTFGSEGSSQLQIYDKNLERKAKNKETFQTNIWFRYEMRLRDKKADNLVYEYIKAIAFSENDKYALSKLASGVLAGLIEFKDIQDKRSRLKNRKAMPGWISFVESSKKIDLRNHYKIESTIAQKKKWYNRSMTKLDSKIYLSNPKLYIKEHIKNLKDAFEKLSPADIIAVNKARIENGLELISENSLEKYIYEDKKC